MNVEAPIEAVTDQTSLLLTEEQMQNDKPARKISFGELKECIFAEPAQVVRCWHPEPEGRLFPLKNGVNVEVNEGAAAYQISTGDIITEF